ncbi:cation:H+ antiporter [Halogranum gelatinilyticum]|uniref:Cation:H+ antiporter n=1 Tax=Halogranum gelatinilyticum TaxID=660521 RepID=A0A1G9ZLC2_9EURY|nr:sodium:calcium antiporter [Halogranum gelatinilyticum]SDN22110.1 cation:H+ antiporter [Halogranum gelatinilyticum]
MVLGGLFPDTPVVNVLVILVATGFIWFGSSWLEESAERLSGYYGLPAVVQGSIVVAVGSSFPELASVVFTALAGTFDMGVGAIVGSAIFNILVIPALSGIVSDGNLETNRTIVYKEAQFYMIAVSTVVVTFALAVIYLPVPGGPVLTGQVTRPLAMLPLLLYGLYLFIQWQDVNDHDGETVTDGVSIFREWGKLAVSLLVILVAVEQLVGGVESLGTTFGIPEFLAGVTIIAAATSLPDTLVSVRTAKANKGVTSLGNVLGSNTFDLLVAIPIGVLIVGSVTIDFAVAVPMLGVLTLATVLLFSFLRTDLSVTSLEAYTLLVAYLLFVAWVVAESLGITSVIRVA